MKLIGKTSFCAIAEPSNQYEEPYWGINLVLTPETRKRYEEELDKIWEDHDQTPKIAEYKGDLYLSIRRKFRKWDDIKKKKIGQKPPLYYNEDGEILEHDVWHGSTCEVEFKFIRWEYSKGQKKGISLDLIAVKVIDEVMKPDKEKDNDVEYNDDIPF